MATAIHATLFIIGAILIALGILSFRSSRRLILSGTKTEATVVENIPSRDDKGVIMYAPLMEYSTNGEIKTYTPNTGASPPAYNIGEKVTLVYHPQNAKDIRILSYWGMYSGSNILWAMGLPMLLIGCGYFLFKTGII
ncbi:Protein of unknown function [Niabella drilacis]|uniref:DUF3592 domain-containing protein n=2 Tax=Niabella drilacis (strain DSM 25811 / CCM 8410 / CCUG 62505 / LMG 26954 / E90) TaxID=1285928 RepID=A0A1G6TDN8_NIADE|nr:Protein of unknown function [Niabella drilacis]